MKFKIPMFIGAVGLLSGCGLPPAVTAFSYAVDGVSYVASGKSTADHAISAAAEKDCALFRAVQGHEICRDEEEGNSAGPAIAMTSSRAPNSAAQTRTDVSTVSVVKGKSVTGWEIAGKQWNVSLGKKDLAGPSTGKRVLIGENTPLAFTEESLPQITEKAVYSPSRAKVYGPIRGLVHRVSANSE